MANTKRTKHTFKDIITIIIGVIAIGIAIYNYFFDTEAEGNDEGVIEQPIGFPSNSIRPNGGGQELSLWEIDYENDALPVITNGNADQYIAHQAYKTSYNKDFKVPNWVFYELTQEEIKGKLERSNNFQPDPKIKSSEAAHLEDYKHSGWDRGHMAPSMDMNWDETVLDEAYLLSNMCPQGHDFNSGIWLDLEHQVRYWAKRDSAICVVCGPILPKSKNEKYRTLPQSKVLIPEYFYKVVFAPFAKKGPRAIAFVMPNHQQPDKISSFAVTVDEVEALTGIDFFSILPDGLEESVESTIKLEDWFRKRDI